MTLNGLEQEFDNYVTTYYNKDFTRLQKLDSYQKQLLKLTNNNSNFSLAAATSSTSTLHTLLFIKRTLYDLAWLMQRETEAEMIQDQVKEDCTIEHLKTSLQPALTSESIKTEIQMQQVLQAQIKGLLINVAQQASSDDCDQTFLCIARLLRNFFSPMKLIGAGKTAEVYLGNHQKHKLPFVVLKNIKRPSKHVNDDILQSIVLHEITLGLALNHHRNILGTSFAYVYGSVIVRNLENETKFHTDVIAISQYIKGYTVIDLITKNQDKWSSETIQEVLHQTFLQISYILLKAQACCKFIHFDLHNANVLCRRCSPNTVLELKYESLTNEKIEHRFDNVRFSPTILDLGQAVLCYNDRWIYNRWKLEDHNILQVGNGLNPEPYLPLFDLYRYITSVIVELGSFKNKRIDNAVINIRRIWLDFWRGLSLDTHYRAWFDLIDDPRVFVHEWVTFYKDNKLAYPLLKHKDQFTQKTLFQWVSSISH